MLNSTFHFTGCHESTVSNQGSVVGTIDTHLKVPAAYPTGFGFHHRGSAHIYKNSQFGLTNVSTERTRERLNRVGLDGVSYIQVQSPRPTRFFTQLG